MKRKKGLLLVCLMVVVSLSLFLSSDVSGQDAIIPDYFSSFKAYAVRDISSDMLTGAVSNFDMDVWFAEKHLAQISSSKFRSGDMVRTTHNAVYMRSGPGTSYPHVRWLAKGAVAEVKYHWNNGAWADQHYWWYVQLEDDGQHGWIVETYLEAINGGSPGQPPGQPNLRSPRSGASDVPVRPTFQWDPVSGATKYALVVVADYLPNGIIIETSGTSHTLSTSNTLREDELHMWSVMAGNSAGWGESADNRHFWTEKSEQTGSVQINIEPYGARSAGAQWRLTSGPDQGWKNSGATIRDLPTGYYTVTFRDIWDWERPSDISVRVSEGSMVTRTATYSADDKVPDCVISTPDAPSGPTRGEVGELYFFSLGGANCSAGHRVEYQLSVRFDGSNWEKSDFGFPTSFASEFLDEGVHELRTIARCTVNHEAVSAWSPLHTIIIGEVEKAGSARVIIEPYGARSAGAQWRLTSGPDQGWKNSSATIRDLPTGSYTVSFRDIGGWDRPAQLMIDVLAGEIVTKYARYTEDVDDSVQSVRLTAEPSRQAAVYETIVLTAEATGGVNREYLFYYRTQPGGKMTTIGSWRSNNYLRARANREGEYRIGVEVRSRGSSQSEASDEITYTIGEEAVEPVTAVSLSASPQGPTGPGELVTLTAEATGGIDPEYSFGWRPKGASSWIHARGYAHDNTYSAAPLQAGEYEVVVLARSAGSHSRYDAYKKIDHTIATAAVDPVVSVSLSASPPSPTRAGDLITLTAEATGGIDPEYSFGWRPKGSRTWIHARGYTHDNTYSAAPNQAGEYEVIVLARSAGSQTRYDASKTIGYTISERVPDKSVDISSKYYTNQSFNRYLYKTTLVGQCTWYVYGRIQEAGLITRAEIGSALSGNASDWFANLGVQLSANTRAIILEHEDNGVRKTDHIWWHLEITEGEYRGKQGWLSESFLEASTAGTSFGAGSTVRVTSNNVNFRTGPGTDYPVVEKGYLRAIDLNNHRGARIRPGDIAVWSVGYNHVAFVEEVTAGVPKYTESNSVPAIDRDVIVTVIVTGWNSDVSDGSRSRDHYEYYGPYLFDEDEHGEIDYTSKARSDSLKQFEILRVLDYREIYTKADQSVSPGSGVCGNWYKLRDRNGNEGWTQWEVFGSVSRSFTRINTEPGTPLISGTKPDHVIRIIR